MDAEDRHSTLWEELDDITSCGVMVDNTNGWCPFTFDFYLLGLDALTEAVISMRRGK